MEPIQFKSPKELQILLGERVRRLRLSRNLDQITTAEKAGVSEKALRSLETGGGSTVETFVRVLKALDALSGLDAFVPTPTVDPMALLRLGKEPQRARRPRKSKPKKELR
jgi:transcriptional regulator with XRE-family HTH domain